MQNKRQIVFTNEFKKNLKNIAKKYRKIKSDLSPYITNLELGKTLGEQLQNIPYKVYKIRIPNHSNNKGKRSGFRLIYYLQLSDKILSQYIQKIYSKIFLILKLSILLNVTCKAR